MDVSITDEAWSENEEGPLLARIYRCVGGNRTPLILDVHGGAWSSGDRTNGELYDTALAQAGFTVVAIDFHQGPKYQHPSASRDVVAALKWARMHADRLNIDTSATGMIGSSSGGHLVMYAGVVPNAEFHQGGQVYVDAQLMTAPVEVPASVAYVMALWPVSDPFFRYRYAKRAGLQRLVAAHDGFYGSEQAMRAASVPRVVASGEAECLPALLVVQPGEDANVPVEMTFDLLRAWQSRGGYVEYAYFPDQPHGFGQRPGPATHRLVELLTDFARRQTGRDT